MSPNAEMKHKSNKRKRRDSEQEQQQEEHEHEDSKIRKVDKDKAKSKLATDMKSTKARMNRDDEFVSDIVSLMYIPKHKLQGEEDDDDDEEDMDVEEEEEENGENKTSRAASVHELHERLRKKMEELRGTFSVVGYLLK